MMSFLIKNDGKLYEKNLGMDSAQFTTKMNQYNPGDDWIRLEVKP